MMTHRPSADRALRNRQVRVVSLLFGGYASLYFRRADLSMATPLLVEELSRRGLLGPYSYLGGAFAFDFGGKEASAIASGILDGIGYLAALGAGLLYVSTVRAAAARTLTDDGDSP